LLNREVDVAVNCSKEQEEERVEITLQAGGFRLRSEESHRIFTSLRRGIDTLERQLDKYKTRWSNKKRSGPRFEPVFGRSQPTYLMKRKMKATNQRVKRSP
jgi:ribosome-associated translation inhibitor RaiA